jgi:SAM-dependent methyltransferase
MPKQEPFDDHYPQYEDWFEKHKFAYLSELKAVRQFIPSSGNGFEVGIGTGRFAKPLGIKVGIDPSFEMRKIAQQKGLDAIDGVAEEIPFPDKSFDYVLMVTTVCFVDDINLAFREVHRILKPNGLFIVGFVDKKSPLGEKYLEFKEENIFYKHATFFSTEEIVKLLKEHQFHEIGIIQTVFGELQKIDSIQQFKSGYGEGGFVVIKGEKERKKIII